jgi:hypothetical protein
MVGLSAGNRPVTSPYNETSCRSKLISSGSMHFMTESSLRASQLHLKHFRTSAPNCLTPVGNDRWWVRTMMFG